MAVSSTTNKVTYSCDGSQTVFPFTFRIFLTTDLEVIETDTDGVETTLVNGSDYDVTAPEQDFTSGGNVTTKGASSPLPATSELTINRVQPLTQLVDYTENDAFPAETHEQALDKLTMITQQLDEKIARNLTVPITDSEPGLVPNATERASKFLAFDASGDPIASVGASSAPVTAAAATVLDDTTIAAMRATLGLIAQTEMMPALLAADDSPATWKAAAAYTFGSTEDAGDYINDLVTAGTKVIHLAPGTFNIGTRIYINSTEDLTIRGQGTISKLLAYGSVATNVLQVGPSFTGKGNFFDFSVDINGKAVGGIEGDAGPIPMSTRWENIEVLNIPGGQVGFSACWHLSRCVAHVDTESTATSGFSTCHYLTDCVAHHEDISGAVTHNGFISCTRLSNCSATADAVNAATFHIGFSSCVQLSSCRVETVATNAAAYCFYACDLMTACYGSGGGDCFNGCDKITVSYALSAQGAGFDDCDHVVGCESTSNDIGFDGCTQCQQNYAHSNTTSQYASSYADQASNACANTSAGGYNR